MSTGELDLEPFIKNYKKDDEMEKDKPDEVGTREIVSKNTYMWKYVEVEAFSSGGFRKAYKATSITPGFSDTTWVIKRYLPEALNTIQTVGQTVEELKWWTRRFPSRELHVLVKH